MATDNVSLTKLWKQAQTDHGYEGSFADFADVYNKNKSEAAKGLGKFVDFLKGVKVAPDNVTDEEKMPFDKLTNQPQTRIFGMPPVAAAVVVVIALVAVGFGIKKVFFPSKKAST